MWAIQDDNYRLCETQFWLWANRGRPGIRSLDLDVLANELSQVSTDDPLHRHLLDARLETTLKQLPEGFLETWRPLENPRPVGPGLAQIVFLKGDEKTFLAPGELVGGAFGVVVRETPHRWLVAGLGDHPPRPGWPPTLGGPTDIVP